MWGAAGTGFTFALTALGAATVFLFAGELPRRWEQVMLGFAAGVMTAASVWSLLLPALERAAEGALPVWMPCAIGLTAGMVFLSGLDIVLPRLHRQETWRRNTLLMAAITLHNVPEGMAVGLAFALARDSASLAAASALALGIGIQNFPEGAAISLPMRQQGVGRGRAFLYGAASGVVEPIFGMAVLLCAAGAERWMPWLLSFAAGAMLYGVVAGLVPQAKGLAGTAGFGVGFLIMMVLDVALG